MDKVIKINSAGGEVTEYSVPANVNLVELGITCRFGENMEGHKGSVTVCYFDSDSTVYQLYNHVSDVDSPKTSFGANYIKVLKEVGGDKTLTIQEAMDNIKTLDMSIESDLVVGVTFTNTDGSILKTVDLTALEV